MISICRTSILSMRIAGQNHCINTSNRQRKKIELIFDAVAKNIATEKKDIASLKTVIDSFDLQGRSLLEVGCGTGDNLVYCAENGLGYAEGIDISGISIKKAKMKADKFTNIYFNKYSIEEYEPERKFDFILAWGVFEYVDNPVDSLIKLCRFLQDKGVLILLISKPIIIKKISFIFRSILSRFPLKVLLPLSKLMGKIFRIFTPIFEGSLYTGESSTYGIEQTILEGLMVPRYNVFNHEIFTNIFLKNKFAFEFFDGVSPSMTCIIAHKMGGAS